MKFRLRSFFLFFLAMVFSFQLSAQSFEYPYDSIPVFKPQKNKLLYQISDPALSTILIKTKRTKRSRYPAGQVLGDVGRGVLTMIFGGVTDVEDSDEVTWKLRGKLICNVEEYNWDINLFCSGESVILSERIRNEDDTYSIETYEDRYFNWDKEATGIVIEKKDTISKFIIVMDPLQHTVLKQRAAEIFSQSDQMLSGKIKNSKEKWLQKQMKDSSVDYGIIGNIRGKNFVIIGDGISRKAWVFDNEKLCFVFQADTDDLYISTEDRKKPYILIDSSVNNEERYDWFRLAVLNKYLSITLVNTPL